MAADPTAPSERPEDVVRAVTEALGRGDLLRVVGRVTADVRWAVSVADRSAAPWFRVYQGRADLPAFFAELAKLQFTDFTLRALTTDGTLVMTLLHVAFTAPNGRAVDMDEVQVWHLRDGKVCRVDTLLDTAAVAAAFA